MNLKARIQAAREENPDKQIDCYMTFPGHFDALAMHEAAHAAGIESRISTTPRAIQSSCGVAVLLDCDDVERLQQLAEDQGLSFEQVVPLPRQIDPRRDRYC